MRVALVVSGLPPYTRSSVEVHGAALASALVAEGHQVEVCSVRSLPGLAPLAQRREEHDGWAVTWINDDPAGDGSGPGGDEASRADAFAEFLDRERPDVVHFESVSVLGLSAIHECAGRGLPTVYTAHDWFAVSDQVHLIAPDGSTFQPDDRELEARMTAARDELRASEVVDAVSDHALPEELDASGRQGLEAWIAGEREGEALEAARDTVRERSESKREAFSSLGARFAATKFMARRLSATLGRAVDWRGPGIDTAAYNDASLAKRSGPLRFGYVGPLGRADGAHLLLEAFAELEPGRATLVLYGDSPEREHLRRLRSRARELDVEWGGPYRAEDVPALLENLDVRVIPTLWEGGAPFEALEACAARRPVIAPRSDALGDQVRDDVDGVLFAAGDPVSLREAMVRFLDEEFLLDRFGLEQREPRTIRAEAREWVDTYGELLERRAMEPRVPVPSYAQPFRERYEAFEKLSTRDLLGQVLAGLGLLAQQMQLTSNPRDLLLLAAGRGSGLRDTAAADRRVIERLQRSVQRVSAARDELAQRAGASHSQLDELKQRLEEREGALAHAQEERSRVEEACAALAKEKDASEEERDRLETELSERSQAAKSLSQELDSARSALEKLTEERDLLENTLNESTRELRLVREKVVGDGDDDALADHMAIELHFDTLEKELRGLKDHEIWLRGEIGGLLEELTKGTSRSHALESEKAGLDAGLETLERLGDELKWRRDEMRSAREASSKLFARLLGGELVKRMQSWEGQA